MSTKPSNPQVFPLTQEVEVAGRKTMHTTGGITLRDLFAIHLMAARYANPNQRPDQTDADAARAAYERADALLMVREEP
jgi:hypothetical protein